MAGLSQAVRDRMRQRAQSIRDRMNKGGRGPLAPRWDLSGKNTVIQPGGWGLFRPLPRWDYASFLKRAGDKVTLDPKYYEEEIYFTAWEHWWDTADGHPTREWCPKTFDENAACPICEAASELMASGNKDDREMGKRVAAKDVYLFNAVMGPAGKRRLDDHQQLDIRILPVGGAPFSVISDFMTGGEQEEFARGDIGDPREGYDLKFTRPAGQGNRWVVDCAPKPTPAFTDAERQGPAKGWIGKLINIPEIVQQESKSYEDLHKAYFGAPPEGAAAGDEAPDRAGADVGEADAEGAADWEWESPGAATTASPGAADVDPDAGFDLPDDEPARPAASRPAGRAPAAPAKPAPRGTRPAASRPAPGRGRR